MSKRHRPPTPKRGWQPLEKAVLSHPEAYADTGLKPPDACYRNDRYSVFTRNMGHGAVHISLHRHDRAAVRDWRHFQQIKNEVAGPERTAIEVFPPESQLVDAANEYHLFVLPIGSDFPFILPGGRMVSTQEQGEAQYGKTRARQRPWEPGLTTGLGAGAK